MVIHEHGSGAPLVLLHGSPTSAKHLLQFARTLPGDWRLLAPEMPGYGGTPAMFPCSLEAAQIQIEDELLARGIDEIRVLGVSLGGYRALALSRGRLRVRSVITLGGLARMTSEDAESARGFAELLSSMDHFDLEALRPALAARAFSASWVAAHPEAVDEVLSWLAGTTPKALAAEQVAVADADDLLAAGGFDVPVTAIVGDQDVSVPPPYSAEIAGAAGDLGRLVVIEGAGHMCYMEQPQAVIDAIMPALD